MTDAGDILDAGNVSEMPETETASMKGKGIMGGENLDWGRLISIRGNSQIGNPK